MVNTHGGASSEHSSRTSEMKTDFSCVLFLPILSLLCRVLQHGRENFWHYFILEKTRQEIAYPSTQRLLHFNPQNKPCNKDLNSRKGEYKTKKPQSYDYTNLSPSHQSGSIQFLVGLLKLFLFGFLFVCLLFGCWVFFLFEGMQWKRSVASNEHFQFSPLLCAT